MKKILISLNIIIATLIGLQGTAALANEKPEVKRVCVKDDKTGKETCKNVKVHKKLEGTPVPEKKK